MTTTKNLLALMILVFHLSTANAQCTAISSGNWTDPANWSCGYVPGCGDLMIIPAGIVITLDSHLNIEESDGCNTPSYIQVFGTLHMQTGKKINMSCGSSVEIMAGGVLQHGVGGGMSNWIKICGNLEWSASDGHVPGYHLFGSAIPLPTTFTSFNVTEIGTNEFACNWTVESERNVDYYRIEYSDNGEDWLTVSTTQAYNSDATQNSYQTIIELSESGSSTLYFRLSSIDINGQITLYSNLFVLSGKKNGMTVFPNPVTSDGVVTVQFHSGLGAEHVIICDQLGKQLMDLENSERSSSVTIPSGTLMKGTYFISSTTTTPVMIVVE